MPELVELNEKQKQTITSICLEWARLHPDQESPFLQTASGEKISPRRIVDEIENPESLSAKVIFRLFAAELTVSNEVDGEPETLDDMLDSFHHDIKQWSKQRPEL